MSRKHS